MELHQYQKNIANFIAKHRHCILSVDMGLGKTASVLHWLDWFQRRSPRPLSVVVICPKRVALTVWKQEAEKWGLSIAENFVIVAGDKKHRLAALDDSHPYKIVSRDNLAEISGRVCDVVIFDELTSFKNITSKRTKAAMSLCSPVKIGLTGTFLANGAIDIYAQAAVCDLQMGERNFYAWRATHFRDVMKGSGQAFSKWKLTTPLPDLLRPLQDNIFTLTAADYLTIPPVTETTHLVPLDDDTSRNIAELDAFLATEINGEVVAFSEKSKFAKLQTICNGFVYSDEGVAVRSAHSAKLSEVADFVQECKEQGERVLLFYAYTEERKWLSEMMTARHITIGTPDTPDFLTKWNEGDFDCLMCHPASAGHGLNLQHGGRVIVWATLTYNYELFAQGNARLARQGQQHNVQIHYFVAKKTVEERVLAVLNKKNGEQKQFLQLTKQ